MPQLKKYQCLVCSEIYELYVPDAENHIIYGDKTPCIACGAVGHKNNVGWYYTKRVLNLINLDYSFFHKILYELKRIEKVNNVN